MRLFTLTPRDPYGRNSYNLCDVWGRLRVNNWFYGVHAHGPPGFYLVPVESQYPFPSPSLYVRKYMIPYVEETLQTLRQKNRLLLVVGRDYTNDTSLDVSQFYKHPIVHVGIQTNYPSGWEGRQLMVTYGVETLRPNEIQLFVGSEYQQTVPVTGSCRRAILIDIPDTSFISFLLRPVGKELYINSVDVDFFP